MTTPNIYRFGNTFECRNPDEKVLKCKLIHEDFNGNLFMEPDGRDLSGSYNKTDCILSGITAEFLAELAKGNGEYIQWTSLKDTIVFYKLSQSDEAFAKGTIIDGYEKTTKDNLSQLFLRVAVERKYIDKKLTNLA